MKKALLVAFASLLFWACQKEKTSFGTAVSDTFYLQNRGVSMPVRVRGNTASRVFLIMVHGGPGADALIYRQPFVVENVEPKCAVVYWDQRNSGSSQGGQNGQHDAVEVFIEDLEKVVALLKNQYGADVSIFLNGHSWGGFLVPAFLQKGENQKNVKGWIQTAGAHNIPLLNQFSLKMQLEKAETEIAAGRNTAKWTEIRDFCQAQTLPLTLENSLRLNQFSAIAASLTDELPETIYTQGFLINQYLENHAALTQILLNPSNPLIRSLGEQLFSGKQVSDDLGKITIPTLLLYGKYDYTCPPQLADDIESRIGSAFKKKVVLEKSGHVVMQSADEKAYWAEVLAFLELFK